MLKQKFPFSSLILIYTEDETRHVIGWTRGRAQASPYVTTGFLAQRNFIGSSFWTLGSFVAHGGWRCRLEWHGCLWGMWGIPPPCSPSPASRSDGHHTLIWLLSPFNHHNGRLFISTRRPVSPLWTSAVSYSGWVPPRPPQTLPLILNKGFQMTTPSKQDQMLATLSREILGTSRVWGHFFSPCKI